MSYQISNAIDQEPTRWVVHSGSLYSSVQARSAEEAVILALESNSPAELGELACALEDGKDAIFAVFFHTESLLKKHDLWIEARVEASLASS